MNCLQSKPPKNAFIGTAPSLLSRRAIVLPAHRTIVLLLLFGLAFTTHCGRAYSGKTQPRATRGVIDLRAWNFEKDGPLELRGEWEFYWRHFLTAQDFISEITPARTGYLQMPGIWNRFTLKGKKLPGQGYATFRLRLLLDRPGRSLSLKLPDFSTSYRLFLDKRELAAGGRPAKTRDAAVPDYRTRTVTFNVPEKTCALYLHISNHHHAFGGLRFNIRLGTPGDIRRLREDRLSLTLFLFGTLFIMGLYHLGLFAIRRRDRSPLYFSLFCLCVGILNLIWGERYLYRLFPNMSFFVILRVNMLVIGPTMPLFAHYMGTIFPREMPLRVRHFYTIVAGIFFLPMIACPYPLASWAAIYYQYFIGLFCLHAVVAAALALFRRRSGSVVFALGILAFAAATINDILRDSTYLRTEPMVPMGLAVFIFSQAFLLSSRFSGAFTESEKLAEELTKSNREITSREEEYRTLVDISIWEYSAIPAVEEGSFCKPTPPSRRCSDMKQLNISNKFMFLNSMPIRMKD